MSDTSDLTPPGSAVYDSQTMYVGDGTWDSKANTFLLPNLQGLNFDTMRYNGMGNRFSKEAGYKMLIEAHGILAAITFLFVVPFAIVFLRFYSGPIRHAVRIHIWCQVLTLFTTTALFALGVLAVGHQRSFTNPHHGVGMAIYVLVLFQFFLGWLTYSRQRHRRKPYAPVKAHLHRWLGRATALLGLAQVPMGLTLYGSPVWLFILYTLVVFAWIVIYFVQAYLDEKHRESDYGDGGGSYVSGDGSARPRRQSRFSTLAKTAAAGAGIAYVANRLRHRNDPPPPGSRHSGSYLHNEKYSDDSVVAERKGGLFRKVLGIGALGGIGYFLGRLWGRRKDEGSVGSASYTDDSGTDDRTNDRVGTRPPGPGPYAEGAPNGALSGAPPPAGIMAAPAAVPAAAAIASSHHHRHNSHYSTEYSSDDDYSSASPSHKRRHHGIRDTVMGLGALGLARNLFKNRKAKKEEARIAELRQQDVEEERINRANSQRHRFTGDGVLGPAVSDRRNSLTNTDLTPIPAGGTSLATGAAIAPFAPQAPYAQQPPYIPQGPYEHPAYGGGGLTIDGQPLPVVPPPPRDPNYRSSGSELYTAHDGTPHHRHHVAEAAAAGLAAGAAGLAAGEALRNRHREHSTSRRTSASTAAGNTPPVSVKLNMHNDGRHVTLRRLTEEEAAADRARQRPGRRGSSPSDDAGGRWRRPEGPRPPMNDPTAERQRLHADQARLNAGQAPRPPGTVQLPPPPPIPETDLRPGSMTSPGTHDGSATEASTNYERNRRRRRAERAASGQRQRVEFD